MQFHPSLFSFVIPRTVPAFQSEVNKSRAKMTGYVALTANGSQRSSSDYESGEAVLNICPSPSLLPWHKPANIRSVHRHVKVSFKRKHPCEETLHNLENSLIRLQTFFRSGNGFRIHRLLSFTQASGYS